MISRRLSVHSSLGSEYRPMSVSWAADDPSLSRPPRIAHHTSAMHLRVVFAVPGKYLPLRESVHGVTDLLLPLLMLAARSMPVPVRPSARACRCAAIAGDAFRGLTGEGTVLRRQLLLEAQTYVNSIC